MIKSKVRLVETESVDAKIDEILDAIDANLEETANEVFENAKSTSLFADKTGDLRNSIKKKKSKFENGGYIVETKAPHAHLIEFGHVLIYMGRVTGRRVAPRPFMRQALEKGHEFALRKFRSGNK